MHLEEQERKALRKIIQRQQNIKRHFYQSASAKDFQKG
jgi:hypothetical protein